MPRPRLKHNAGLPARWHYRHGAYFYRVPPAQRAAWDGKTWFLLGHSLPEAYKVYAAKLETAGTARTIGELLDRYAREVVPAKAKTTQASNGYALKPLRAVFGPMQLATLRPQHVYQYVDRRKVKVAAHREVEVLSHACTKAVEWGLIDRHPFKGEVRLAGEKPRTRYVEDWEIAECLALPNTRKRGSVLAIQAYIRLKLGMPLRRSDILRIRVADCKEDGVHAFNSKTGKRQVFKWSAALRQAVVDAKASRPVDISPWLFCNRRGECYVVEETGVPAGFKSMWQRFMTRVLAETKVAEPFNEHDIRAKVLSDADSLERAQELGAHDDPRTTKRVYRRKPEIVEPAK